ncbi:BMC domain-containing protein [bacterium]|nr:BMC domain-containing protein [bacterium]
MGSRQALGMIETMGFIGAVEAADAAVKTANVKIVKYASVDGGLVSIHVRGDVGAVQAAVDAAAEAARKVGTIFAVHVVPAPHEEVDEIMFPG